MKSQLHDDAPLAHGGEQTELRTKRQNRLRILALVAPDAAGRRASRHSFLYEELEAMVKAGAEVHAISHHIPATGYRVGVLIHRVPRIRNLGHTARALYRYFRAARQYPSRLSACRYLLTVRSVMRHTPIDVVYSPFLWPCSSAGLPAAEEFGVPVVASLRGADVLVEPAIGYGRTLNPFHRQAVTDTLARATMVVGVSNAMVQRAIELGVDERRTRVVLKGVSTQHFTPGSATDARRRLGWPDRATVLYVGHLIKRKGVDVLLQACARVARSMDVHVVLCGEGPERASLVDLAEKLGISADVTFMGRVPRDVIPDCFRACDVHVLPSLAEGSGNVILEAYASGKPVVGTGDSGIVDYVDDGVTGFLFRKADAEDLASKLLRILSDHELAQQLGANGLLRAKTRHAESDVIDQLFDVFRIAVESGSKHGPA